MAAVKVVLPLPLAHAQGRIPRLPEGPGQKAALPAQQAQGLAGMAPLSNNQALDIGPDSEQGNAALTAS